MLKKSLIGLLVSHCSEDEKHGYEHFSHECCRQAYPHLDPFDLRADTMRPLFRYADECAQAGRLWTVFGRTSDDGRTIRSTAETVKVPCPADDAFIRYFAAR